MIKENKTVEIQASVQNEPVLHEKVEKNELQKQPVQKEDVQKDFVEQLKERNTMQDVSDMRLSGTESADFAEVQGRKTFQEMSSSAETRKQYLKNGKQMPEKVKQEYIQEYKEEHGGQQTQQQKSSVDLVAEANAPLVGLRELLTSLSGDTAQKSESFQKMEQTLQELVSMTFRSTWEINDYAAAFWAAKQAAQAYLDSHKRGRWTSRGESRKQTAKQIRDILQKNEEQYTMKLLEAKQMKLKEKGLDEEFNRQAEVTETLIWDDQDAPHPIKEEEVQRVVKSGSIEEKLFHYWIYAAGWTYVF